MQVLIFYTHKNPHHTIPNKRTSVFNRLATSTATFRSEQAVFTWRDVTESTENTASAKPGGHNSGGLRFAIKKQHCPYLFSESTMVIALEKKSVSHR